MQYVKPKITISRFEVIYASGDGAVNSSAVAYDAAISYQTYITRVEAQSKKVKRVIQYSE